MNRVYIAAILLVATIIGCTDNMMAKQFGGTMTVKLPKGKELVNVTWKDTQMWYLIKDRPEGKPPQVYEFVEKSNYEILEGKVVFEEQ